MKKKINLIAGTLVCLFLTGCGNVDLDLNKVSENLNDLTTGKFDLLTAVENIEMDETYFGELSVVYDFDLENLGINNDNIEDMAFRVDSKGNPAYIIVKPVDGKKATVKDEISSYLNQFTDLNEKLEAEYEGYLLYLFSEYNEDLLELIKGSESRVFGMLMDVTDVDLEALTGINPEDLDEFLVKNSVMTQASSYYILKPKSDKVEEVKEKLDEYMTRLEQQWETYLPDQYELVDNRLEKEYGGYIIYIISNDNEKVLETIKECKKDA